MFDNLEQFPEGIVEIFKKLGKDVIEDILKRMEQVPEIISSSDYELWKLNQLGFHKREIKKLLKDALKKSNEEINKIYDETIKQEYVRAKEIYQEVGADFIPYEENKALQQLIEACKVQSKGDFKNLTGTIGFVVNGKGKKEDEYFKEVLNTAQVEISTGVFDYSKAIKKAVDEMTNSGVRYIDYESGHRDRVEVAVRRAVMTGVSQTVNKIAEENAKKLGTDKFEVSAHATARPTHQVWQGRVYTKQELIDVCGLGTVTGLCGANCYHHYDPFIEGISVRKYTDEQLDEMNKEANKKAKYGDKEYTKYEATQEQRRIERQLRGLKEKINYLKKYGGSKDDIDALKTKYNSWMERYKDFSKKMDLPFQPERIHVKTNAIGKLSNFEKELSDIYDKVSNGNYTREEITGMFSKEKYLIGTNKISGNKIYVKNKDLSYFLFKHGKEIPKYDLLKIFELSNYDRIYKNIDNLGNQIGYAIYKKSLSGIGYTEGVTKYTSYGEELFHFQYLGKRTYLNKFRKIKDNLIENMEV